MLVMLSLCWIPLLKLLMLWIDLHSNMQAIRKMRGVSVTVPCTLGLMPSAAESFEHARDLPPQVALLRTPACTADCRPRLNAELSNFLPQQNNVRRLQPRATTHCQSPPHNHIRRPPTRALRQADPPRKPQLPPTLPRWLLQRYPIPPSRARFHRPRRRSHEYWPWGRIRLPRRGPL